MTTFYNQTLKNEEQKVRIFSLYDAFITALFFWRILENKQFIIYMIQAGAERSQAWLRIKIQRYSSVINYCPKNI